MESNGEDSATKGEEFGVETSTVKKANTEQERDGETDNEKETIERRLEACRARWRS
jgi:hypothetical protein